MDKDLASALFVQEDAGNRTTKMFSTFAWVFLKTRQCSVTGSFPLPVDEFSNRRLSLSLYSHLVIYTIVGYFLDFLLLFVFSLV